MRIIVLTVILCFSYVFSFAQKINTDSLAYELQRKKINTMLEARHTKFGQYAESLKKHSGIFGMQTKKDIRRSNDILMDITKTDESIFEQIKILLNYRNNQLSYRTFQQQRVQTQSTQMENYNLGYMNTINKLRQQIETQKQAAAETEHQHEKTIRIFIILVVLMLGSILYLLYKKRPATT